MNNDYRSNTPFQQYISYIVIVSLLVEEI